MTLPGPGGQACVLAAWGSFLVSGTLHDITELRWFEVNLV